MDVGLWIVQKERGFDRLEDVDRRKNDTFYDDPSETEELIEINFSKEEFTQRVEEIKYYLLQMENHNSSITDYAKAVSNFYTLWSIVALSQDNLPEPGVFADRYKAFMLKVEELAAASKPDAARKPEDFLSDPEGKAKYEQPFKYFRNVRGASTDSLQRMARDEALRSEILQK